MIAIDILEILLGTEYGITHCETKGKALDSEEPFSVEEKLES